MNEEKKTKLKDRILQEIGSGKISMRPKTYFALQVATIVLLAIAVVALSVFIFNVLIFGLRVRGHGALLGFGLRGWSAFLRFFPWSLLLLDIAMVVLLEWLLRRFRFGYKQPILYLLGGLTIITIVIGGVLSRTRFNERMYEREEYLPSPIAGLYEHARRMPPPGSGICKCSIVAIDGNRIVVQDLRKASSTLTIILPDDDARATTTGLKVGDTIFIAGREDDGVIQAFGIRREVEFHK